MTIERKEENEQVEVEVEAIQKDTLLRVKKKERKEGKKEDRNKKDEIRS